MSLPSGVNFGLPSVLLRVWLSALPTGGDDGIRTHDPLLAGQVLSQLSYTPMVFRFSILLGQGVLLDSSTDVGPDLFSRTVSSKVSSALRSLTSVFGMGTGGPCTLKGPTVLFSIGL